jgi:hypothetical protein
MPKAGTYDYPTRDLDDCVSYLRKAREVGNSTVLKREGFAEAIGMSVKGGGFGLLVGSMSQYGLIDTGSGQIRITDLAEQILYGEPQEKTKGTETAVKNVQLFADIYQRFNGIPSDDQVRLYLREKANVAIAEANDLASEVGKLLKKNLPYLTSAPAGGGGETSKMTTQTSGMIGKLETADYGILNIKDEISMDLAINLLTQIKQVRGWGIKSKSGKGSGEDTKTP